MLIRSSLLSSFFQGREFFLSFLLILCYTSHGSPSHRLVQTLPTVSPPSFPSVFFYLLISSGGFSPPWNRFNISCYLYLVLLSLFLITCLFSFWSRIPYFLLSDFTESITSSSYCPSSLAVSSSPVGSLLLGRHGAILNS